MATSRTKTISTYRFKFDKTLESVVNLLKNRDGMPEVSRFLGIIIKMFFNDHSPPHFHAYYQDFKATFSIKTGQMIDGKIPPKQAAFITAWTLLHQKELMDNWKALIAGKGAKKIEPLR